jgi:glucose/arabinose dehydrogenase
MSRAMMMAAIAILAMAAAARAEDTATRTGPAAFGDWHGDAPGVTRLILPSDLPPPGATRSAGNSPGEVRRRAGLMPQVPAGFSVTLFAEGLEQPRVIRVAPNGDIFVAESGAGRIRLLRAPDGAGAAAESRVFVSGLTQPYGLAFYPPGPNPQWLYIGDTDAVRRVPYRPGDTGARGALETVVPSLPEGGHWTRDIAFSPVDGRLYLAVGSESNDAEDLSRKTPDAIAGFEAGHGLGAAWDDETGRADVLSFTAQGEDRRVLATGLRPAAGLCHRGPARRLLWLALVLYRRSSGSPPPRRTPRSRRPGQPARYPDPAPFRAAPDRLLHRHRVSAGLPRRCLRHPARILEPGQAHRLQGRAPDVPRRRARWPLSGLHDRLRRRRPRGLGPSGRGRGGA